MKRSTKTIFKIIISLILIAAPICVIFYFSGQPGTQSYGVSNKVSTYIATKWNSVFSLNLSDGNFNVLVTSLYMPTRKLGHIVEYAILGWFAYAALYVLQRSVKLSGIFATILLIVLIASCDEIHQSYVALRGSHITDVFIDVVSGIAGIYFLIILKDFCKKVRSVFRTRK